MRKSYVTAMIGIALLLCPAAHSQTRPTTAPTLPAQYSAVIGNVKLTVDLSYRIENDAPILLHIQLVNKGKEPVELMFDSNLPADAISVELARDGAMTRVKAKKQIYEQFDSKPDALVPGASLSREYDLRDYFELEHDSTYLLSVSRRCNLFHDDAFELSLGRMVFVVGRPGKK